MADPSSLERYVDQLALTWKWRVDRPPVEFDREWQRWVAAAQRAEEDTLMRYWSQRSGKAA